MQVSDCKHVENSFDKTQVILISRCCRWQVACWYSCLTGKGVWYPTSLAGSHRDPCDRAWRTRQYPITSARAKEPGGGGEGSWRGSGDVTEDLGWGYDFTSPERHEWEVDNWHC